MKVVSTEALTKLIQLIKSSFISVDDTEQTSEIETETPNEVTLATVATTGDYDDLTNKPTFYHPDLLSFQWSDHLLNNVSWLRADTFSWQDGTVYASAYEHLTDDITGITPTTETIGSNTITVYVASDGHKIVLEDQAQTIQDIYDETGVAWYFILDTTNQRFKLPRTKFGLTGLRDTVGKYVPESLPNHKHWLVKNIIGGTNADNISDEYNKPIVKNQNNGNDWSYTLAYTDGEANTLVTGAVSENSIYQDNAPVQQRATQMYLYFYVGDYTQTAIEQTAGLNTELFNGKADTDLSNITPTAEAQQNITSWAMPDYDSAIALSVSSYTAPSNGWIYCDLEISEGVITVSINGHECATGGGNRSNNDRHMVPIKKGQIATTNTANRLLTFFPCIGG